jgi:hypothetical protein
VACSCGLSGSYVKDGKQSLDQVDVLLGRIERVQVECELSKESVRDATAALDALARPQFQGDPKVAFTVVLEAFERTDERQKALGVSTAAMKKTAEKFFLHWSEDLQGFTNSSIRQRSQDRLEEARARYRTIEAAVDPTLASFGVYNVSLRDLNLFLEHDFNPASVRAVAPEIDALAGMAADLDVRFERSIMAAQDYVSSAALPESAVNEG